jgi:hypothetical protein
MPELKYAKDLQPSYDLALSHNGTENWADNFAVRMIERIDGLMGQITALKGLVLSIEGNRGEVHGGVNFASDTREYGKCPDCGDLAPLKNGYCNFCEPKHKEGLVEERYG